jgi:hypothetical protein
MFIMKKLSVLILGIIIGVALAVTSSVYADDIQSLVGKAIQGEFPVKLDGKTLNKKAVVIDGSSYLPVRVIGDAIGYDVTFDAELGIKLTKKAGVTVTESSTVVETEGQIQVRHDQEMAVKALNDKKLEQIIDIKTKIGIADSIVLKYQSDADTYSKATDEVSKKMFYPNTDFDTWYKQYTDALDKAKADRAELQKQLDNLTVPSPSPTPTP